MSRVGAPRTPCSSATSPSARISGSLGDRNVLHLTPTDDQDDEIDALLLELDELESVTLALQEEATSMLDVRNLFDECMLLHSSASKRLASNSAVVGHADFEVAITKILDQSVASMSDGQVASVDRLKMPPKVLDASQDKPLTLAQRAKKRLKASADAYSYVDCRFIRPTSNMCERFFSWAKYALNDRRRATTPHNFEQQMFLKVNCSLWDVTDVGKLMTT
ncbi:hypothetical protein B5M09_013747 [Aphanomyces astaci]|uniref:HAT C-terminal dimerisation domain-containing protein n=1 Tax=Aphanomyces astaci TaxID=112090 RepID=A0A3R7WT60_APHAT|nr:hypothetical protein B5M09_013747 [Aphanomyces astaci]